MRFITLLAMQFSYYGIVNKEVYMDDDPEEDLEETDEEEPLSPEDENLQNQLGDDEEDDD